MRTRPAATCPGWRNAARQRAHPGLYLRGGPRTKTAQTGYHNMVLTLAAGIPSPKGYMWGRTWDLGARRCRGCFHWVTRPGCGAWAARAAAHSGSSSWRGRQRCSPGSTRLPGLLPAQAHRRPPRLAGSGWRDPPVGMLGIGTPTCFGAIAARPAAAVALAVAEINERVRGGEKGGVALTPSPQGYHPSALLACSWKGAASWGSREWLPSPRPHLPSPRKWERGGGRSV